MRPDVHRPSEIVPNDYELDCAAKLHLGGTCEISAFRKAVRAYEEAQADTPFGYVVKMLVRDDSGFKVWCSCPSAASIAKGNRISMRVSVTPSRDDTKFGFGKRPSNLEVLAALPAAA
jgi:hypothetical protein